MHAPWASVRNGTRGRLGQEQAVQLLLRGAELLVSWMMSGVVDADVEVPATDGGPAEPRGWARSRLRPSPSPSPATIAVDAAPRQTRYRGLGQRAGMSPEPGARWEAPELLLQGGGGVFQLLRCDDQIRCKVAFASGVGRRPGGSEFEFKPGPDAEVLPAPLDNRKGQVWLQKCDGCNFDSVRETLEPVCESRDLMRKKARIGRFPPSPIDLCFNADEQPIRIPTIC